MILLRGWPIVSAGAREHARAGYYPAECLGSRA